MREFPELSQQLQGYKSKANIWQKTVSDTYRNRKAPVFTQESLIKINKREIHHIDDLNTNRTDVKKQIQSAIDRNQTRLFQFQDLMHMQTASSSLYSQLEKDRVTDGIKEIKAEFKSLISQKNQVTSVIKSANEKFWVHKDGTCLRGSIPSLDDDQIIQNDTIPSEAEIMRHISIHPATHIVNLPLSIKMLIEFADASGLSDKQLAVIILIFLKKHKTELFYHLQPKKDDVKLLIDAISLECSNKSEILQVKLELAKFKRGITEGFAHTVNRFDSLYTHFAQLKKPINGIELSRLSINTLKQITPYLVHPKTAKIYGEWSEQEILYNRLITRESIINTINTL